MKKIVLASLLFLSVFLLPLSVRADTETQTFPNIHRNSDQSGRLSVSVLRGPISPVCLPTLSCFQPVQTTVLIKNTDGTVIDSAQTNRRGQFTIRLPVGSYFLQVPNTLVPAGGSTTGNNLLQISNTLIPVVSYTNSEVTVQAHQTTSVIFNIDTGLR